MPTSPKTMPLTSPAPVAIIMAKWPVAGAVKTRLISPALTDTQAAEIAAALLICITRRLSFAFQGRVVLSISPDDTVRNLEDFLQQHRAGLPHSKDDPFIHRIIPQGAGNLGTRIDSAWQQVHLDTALWPPPASNQRDPTTTPSTANLRPAAQPVAFFGIDSPDIPRGVLQRLQQDLADAEGTFAVAAGPVPDGGYWTLAARRYYPEILWQIEWGGPEVFANTTKRAAAAKLNFLSLPNWYDVDEPADLKHLRQRLQKTTDPILADLARKLNKILD